MLLQDKYYYLAVVAGSLTGDDDLRATWVAAPAVVVAAAPAAVVAPATDHLV